MTSRIPYWVITPIATTEIKDAILEHRERTKDDNQEMMDKNRRYLDLVVGCNHSIQREEASRFNFWIVSNYKRKLIMSTALLEMRLRFYYVARSDKSAMAACRKMENRLTQKADINRHWLLIESYPGIDNLPILNDSRFKVLDIRSGAKKLKAVGQKNIVELMTCAFLLGEIPYFDLNYWALLYVALCEDLLVPYKVGQFAEGFSKDIPDEYKLTEYEWALCHATSLLMVSPQWLQEIKNLGCIPHWF